MRMLRLPAARPLALRFLRATVTSLTPFLSLASGSWSCFRDAWALVFRSRHIAPVLSLLEEDSRFSQVPRVPFRAFALLSDPGRIYTPSLLRRFDSAPDVQTTKAPASSIISRLYHTAFALLHTLRAAIADDYAMFASGWWPTFTGWASRPTGSLLCVSESCFRFRLHDLLTFWVYLTRLNFRVEPSVAGWLPHSPVLAQLRHTVLQARISLHRQSGPPSQVESGKTA